MNKEKIWVKNFSAERSGYHSITPIFDRGILDCQRILFGEKTPLDVTEIVLFFEDTNLKGGYLIESELQEFINHIFKMILENPDKVERVHKETYKINEDYIEFSKKTLEINYSQLKDKELGELYLNLVGHQRKSHQNAVTTTWFVDSEGEAFSKFLLKKTKDIVSNSGKDIDHAEAFSTLTTLPKNSLGLQEDIESLKVLKKISGDDKAKQIFLSIKDLSKIPEGVNEELKKEIQQHFEKWRWTQFVYMGPAYNIDYYLSVWSGLLKEKIDTDKEINKLEDRPSKVEKKRNKIIDDLNIAPEDIRLYDLAADIVFLKGHRKDAIFFGSYALSFILKEMVKRLYISLNQIYLLSHREIEGIFINGKKVDQEEINARRGLTILQINVEGDFFITSGEKAKKLSAQYNIKKEKIEMDMKELKGTCACSGTAKGIVRIINTPQEISKMEQGDIMVSHTTFPSLVPAMKKAAAIVTEDGGITCHAAIVSRELETPCITGIKAATSILKDGDLVEVNANEGIVRKI